MLINDIQAHQTSVDTLNGAGRQLVETEKGSDDSNETQQRLVKRLVLVIKKWGDLVGKASNHQKVTLHHVIFFYIHLHFYFICNVFHFNRNWKMP